MKQKKSMKYKLGRITYDKPRLNQTVMTVRKSLNEVSQTLNSKPGTGKDAKK